MNSLNLLSARVIGQSPTQSGPSQKTRSRSISLSESTNDSNALVTQPRRSSTQYEALEKISRDDDKATRRGADEPEPFEASDTTDEKTPLIRSPGQDSSSSAKPSRLHIVAKRLVEALTKSLRWVFSTLAAPGVYVVTCFYDEQGHFSPFSPVRKLRYRGKSGKSSTANAIGLSGSSNKKQDEKRRPERHGDRPGMSRNTASRRLKSRDSISSFTSESEADFDEKTGNRLTDQSRKSPNVAKSDDNIPARRSIRIKLYNEDTTRRRKQKREVNDGTRASGLENPQRPEISAENLKSPTSPPSSLRMTKYPRVPTPPRPLIPRRQPSYTMPSPQSFSAMPQKTLVIDLDETLIHSLAKGGRMSSGHMVEVKLNMPVGLEGKTLGPQHPILYYVHKRPHCDDFLRKICKWYNLVVFTASVQEYADPVIDWLEQERKYFSARYYRQHCTFRNGAYIKDLSSVEPDLSRVMILDNSPLSYIFHEGQSIL